MHLCIQTRWIPCETVEYSLPGHCTLTLSMLTRFGDTSIEKWWIYDCSWRTMRCNTRGKISRGVCGERDGKSKSLWKYIIVINKMLQFLGPLQYSWGREPAPGSWLCTGPAPALLPFEEWTCGYKISHACAISLLLKSSFQIKVTVKKSYFKAVCFENWNHHPSL